MSGAQQHQNVRMGTYTRVSGILKANRPVYRLAGSSLVVYLSYFGTNSLPGNWWLSRDYRNLDNDAVISSTSYAGALCPEQERTWQAMTPTGWLNPYPNLTVAALLLSPTTAAPTRAPTAAAVSGAPYVALTATSCVAVGRSPAANCRCHGLCGSLFAPAGCAESVTLSGAEAEQPTRMGTYSRVPGLLHPPELGAFGRPVYQRVGYGSTVYLWYHDAGGNWWISNRVGGLLTEDGAVVSSSGRNQASCPEQEPVWQALSPSAGWLSPHPSLRIRVADVGARARSRPSAAVRAARPARRVPNSAGVHMRRTPRPRMGRARGLCRCGGAPASFVAASGLAQPAATAAAGDVVTIGTDRSTQWQWSCGSQCGLAETTCTFAAGCANREHRSACACCRHAACCAADPCPYAGDGSCDVPKYCEDGGSGVCQLHFCMSWCRP